MTLVIPKTASLLAVATRYHPATRLADMKSATLRVYFWVFTPMIAVINTGTASMIQSSIDIPITSKCKISVTVRPIAATNLQNRLKNMNL